MGRTRTFIAVDVGDEVRDKALTLQQTLSRSGADMKWVSEDGMHITLLFLGEVDDRELHSICRAVQGVAATEPRFPLRVSGVGAFPNLRRPKIAWTGIGEGVEQLVRLHDRLEEKLLQMGCYRSEGREYTPHLTLGRVKGEEDGLKLAPELTKHLAWNGGRTSVEAVLVFSSVLERDGPVYTVLGRGPLAGGKA
jgi:2'-5' RNA ligase